VIERSLREIDRPRLQVAIDATVAEVTLTDALQFACSIPLVTIPDKGSVGLLPTGNPAGCDSLGAVQSAIQSAFLQRVLPDHLILGPEAQPEGYPQWPLSTLTDVKVLSAPSVVVMDNQPALLQVRRRDSDFAWGRHILTTRTTRSSPRSRCVTPV